MVLKPWLLYFFHPGSADRVHQPTGTLLAAAVPERDGGDQVHGGHQQDPVGEHSPRPRGCLLLEVLQETRGKAAHCCKRRAPVLQETRGKAGHCWKWRAPVLQETRGKVGHCWKWRAPVFQETRGKAGHCWKWRAPVFQEAWSKFGHCWKWRTCTCPSGNTR